MVNQQELDIFIKRMEETYQPSVSYAGKSRVHLQKLLEPNFPSDQVNKILDLAEQMYKSHAQTRQNLTAIKEDLVSIVRNTHTLSKGMQDMADMYTIAVKDLVGAAEELEHASTEVIGAALHVKDAADRVQEEKQNETALFAPPKKKYEN